MLGVLNHISGIVLRTWFVVRDVFVGLRVCVCVCVCACVCMCVCVCEGMYVCMCVLWGMKMYFSGWRSSLGRTASRIRGRWK